MDKKIIIVGSGPSGVAAATKLIEKGFKNLTILEAENRIGGRINTVQFGENVLDMGAQWCHGEKGNVVYEMAKDKDLLAPNIYRHSNTKIIQSNGDQIADDIAQKVLKMADEITHDIEGLKAFKGSYGNYIMNKYNENMLQPEFNDVDEKLRKRFSDLIEKFENSLDASDSWYQSSTRNSVEYVDCEGEFNLTWKDRGTKTVLDLLQKKIPESENTLDITPHLQLNREVKKISYSMDGKSPAVRVECSDGSVYSADHLICTVSLGVLKHKYLSLFEPILPQKKINVIEGQELGTVDKIYLEWDKPFWVPDLKDGFAFLWRPEELKIIREQGLDWLEAVFGFWPVDYQPNILCGWMTGPYARQMESLSDDDVKAASLYLLRMFLKGLNVPDPIRIKRSSWYSNPHFRGSYSYYTLKSDGYGAMISDLAEPLNDSNGKPVIQFAGEATNPTHFSTVHGAVETGWREADRLIESYST